MIWEKKNKELNFNCHCGKKVKKRNTFNIEFLISGNCAYECPNCKTVYDVWTKRNQKLFFIFILIIIIGGIILFG